MKHPWIWSTLAVTLSAIVGGKAVAEDAANAAKSAATASNQFGLDVYAQLAAQQKGNLFLSPYSIESALAMTCGGARGATAQQMAVVLHLDLPPDKLHDAFHALTTAINGSGALDDQRVFDLIVANALWVQKGFALEPAFVNLVKTQYAAGIEPVDFASSAAARERSRQLINAWVERQTRDKIKDLIAAGDLSDLTRLVLTNAIYFKSSWDVKFARNLTKDEVFHLSADGTVQAPMMHQKSDRRYMENASFQAVEIPYQLGRLSMLVMLPRKADGLVALEKSLDAKNFDAWLGAMASREVDLSLPKFTFSSQFELSKTLAGMGMTDAFDPKADFTGIARGDQFFIGGVIHKAFVDVNEEGTEAAAATAVVMRAGAMRAPLEPAVFRADHPFLFLIRDTGSGTILFLGRVVNPKS